MTPGTPQKHTPAHDAPGRSRVRVLITAGPTQEPIDAVRFVGNRSSGRVGVRLAGEAAARGWDVTLLLGPVSERLDDSRVEVRRFRTAADLQGLLREEASGADVLIMAAAVADYRPRVDPSFFGGKFRRKSEPLTLEMEPTPDLLAEVAETRRPGQLLVGFALEPREEMIVSAREKLARKRIDMVVANPLETMDSDVIEAVVIGADGSQQRTDGKVSKAAFAAWLVELLARRIEAGAR